MASVTFGNFQVDTTDPNFVDAIVGTNFDVLQGSSAGPTEITEFFASGAKAVVHGNFTLGLNSFIQGVDLYNPPGNVLVLSITGIVGITVAAVQNLSFPQLEDLLFGQVNEIFTQEFNDVLIGDAANEIAHAGAGNDIIEGNGGNDVLYGEAGTDQMSGGTGNDTLNGGTGADSMAGDSGNDTYVVDDPGDTVIEGSSDGFDTEQSSISRTIDANVERLVLIGAATTATGDNRANVLTGNDGNNVLDGGHGGDSMAGGKGDDTYKVDFGLDQVSEAAGPGTGTDVVDSDVPQVLAANVENLNLGQSAGNIEGIGNAAANTIVGNDSANLLDGGAGDDTLKGQGGDDTLLGGAGNDILNSGLGRDVLSGGAGADHFVFNFAVASGTNVDQIVDFVKGQDVIDLSTAIFSAAGAPGTALAASDFVTGPAAVAHDASDHIIHDTSTGMLYYDADGSGAQQMVAFAQVNLGQALGASDFHLIA